MLLIANGFPPMAYYAETSFPAVTVAKVTRFPYPAQPSRQFRRGVL